MTTITGKVLRNIPALLTCGALGVACLTAVGCSKTETPSEWTVAKKNVIPPNSQLLAQGTASTLGTTMPDNGHVFLNDATDGHVISQVLVAKGDEFTFSPSDGMLTVGKTAPIKLKVDSSHKYEVWFRHAVHF